VARERGRGQVTWMERGGVASQGTVERAGGECQAIILEISVEVRRSGTQEGRNLVKGGRGLAKKKKTNLRRREARRGPKRRTAA